MTLDTLSTGFPELDAATHGGFPCRRITILEGADLDFWRGRFRDYPSVTVEEAPEGQVPNYPDIWQRLRDEDRTLIWITDDVGSKVIKYLSYLWVRFDPGRIYIVKSFVGDQAITIPLVY